MFVVLRKEVIAMLLNGHLVPLIIVRYGRVGFNDAINGCSRDDKRDDHGAGRKRHFHLRDGNVYRDCPDLPVLQKSVQHPSWKKLQVTLKHIFIIYSDK